MPIVNKDLTTEKPVKYSAEEKREFARLRRLLVEPDTIFLATVGDRRYLTDKYVLLDVTTSPAIGYWLEDGTYELRSNLGLKPAVDALVPKTAELIGNLEGCDWREVYPTGWSIRSDHALLVYTKLLPCCAGYRLVCQPWAINAEAWDLFHAAYDDVTFEHDQYAHHPFRIRTGETFLGYVMGVRIPEAEKRTAQLIADNQ